MMNCHRVLVLTPHTDDAELGCGGTIARLIEEDVKVFVAVFSTAEESVPEGKAPDTLKREFLEAMPILGVPLANITVYGYPVRRLSYFRQEVLEEMVKLRRAIDPDLVMLPSENDVHQDHQVVHIEGLRAFKDISILGYELPWNHVKFTGQAFVTLKRHHIERKWQALQAYKSQFELKRPYFSSEFVQGLATVRGTQVKAEMAETFEVLRVKW
jgi:LmbE family N-acetylglucosaminyl deacetylase